MDKNTPVLEFFLDEVVDWIKMLCNILSFNVVKGIDEMLDFCFRLVLYMVHAGSCCYDCVTEYSTCFDVH